MQREHWEVTTAAGAQVFESYPAAMRHLAGLPEQPAMVHRVTRTHIDTLGVPGSSAWPQAPVVPPAAAAPKPVP